jgi:general transcription factor 3C polypeptide 5 (transcription factor C subunit 1)
VEALRDYRIPPENEDYYISDGESQRSNVRVFPPPLFGRQHTSQNYKSVFLSVHLTWLIRNRSYKPNPTSIETTVVDPTTGEERTRLVNKQRWKGWAPIAVQITDSIPTEGPANARAELANTDPGLLEKIKQVLATRPIWSRIALFSQFEANEIREIAK